VFMDNPRLRGYVLDDQSSLRKHIVAFIDGKLITDRERLSDQISPSSEIYVLQALSGG
jgi:molybdopterin synthase sulfur carrier subunit